MNILDEAKTIADLIKKYNDQELYERIINLRAEILELKESNLSLQSQVSELQSKKSVEKSISWDPPYYWIKTGEMNDGPFCQHCYDKHKELIRLQGRGKRKGAWRCEACNKEFEDSDYEPAKSISVVRPNRRRNNRTVDGY